MVEVVIMMQIAAVVGWGGRGDGGGCSSSSGGGGGGGGGSQHFMWNSHTSKTKQARHRGNFENIFDGDELCSHLMVESYQKTRIYQIGGRVAFRSHITLKTQLVKLRLQNNNTTVLCKTMLNNDWSNNIEELSSQFPYYGKEKRWTKVVVSK